eukprot:scaffold3185_cov103-Skeletonema_marinoi.AAC.1
MEEVEEANGHAADDDDYGLADAAAANNIKDREEQRAMKGGDDVVSIGELGLSHFWRFRYVGTLQIRYIGV